MPTPQLSFTKVVFPPTRTVAVHTYTAGSFFAVVSLNTADQEQDVHAIGKELFTNLETEFFSLEEKNLNTIKNVVTTALANIAPGLQLSFAAAYIKDSVAYLFISGGGCILLKRGEKLAEILREVTVEDQVLKSSSGYVHANDMLFLETADFAKHIPTATLQNVHDRLPNEIADMVTGKLQTVENSGAASIILKIEGFLTPQTYAPQTAPPQAPFAEPPAGTPPVAHPQQSFTENHRGSDSQTESEEATPRSLPNIFQQLKSLHLPPVSLLNGIHLSLKTKIGIVIAIIVLILLGVSINGIKTQRQNAQNQQVFHQYYDDAKKHYESGNGIAAVNPLSASAKSEWQKADGLLKTAQQQLPANTPEATQVNDLLTQVDGKLSQSNNIQTVQVSDASSSDSPLLAAEQKQNSQYVSQNDKTIYYINAKGIYTSDSSSAVIKNIDDWQSLGGFAAYESNLYVLDKAKGMIKYVGGSSGYGKAGYFAHDTHPDLGKAVSLAIDSSIYILFSDGTISKFTAGESDTFVIKGIDKPLSSPTRIFTNANTESVYVLDNGNSRIVKFGKDGTYQGQYAADALAKAKDIDVHETDKKIFILTSDGIKSISM